MVIKTNSERVQKARKVLYELLMSDHNKDCLNCKRNTSCELQEPVSYTHLDVYKRQDMKCGR